jgi:hypothetical protein
MDRVRKKIITGIALVLALTATLVMAAPAREKQVQYFAGVMFLQSRGDLPAAAKAQKYRELETLTGVTAREAQNLIAGYRTRPEQWRVMYDSIITLMTRIQPPAKTEVNPTVKADTKPAARTQVKAATPAKRR